MSLVPAYAHPAEEVRWRSSCLEEGERKNESSSAPCIARAARTVLCKAGEWQRSLEASVVQAVRGQIASLSREATPHRLRRSVPWRRWRLHVRLQPGGVRATRCGAETRRVGRPDP